MKAIVGCKLLNGDLSLNGECRYPDDGEWHEISGNGAYVAVTGGLISGGLGSSVALLECREPTGACRCVYPDDHEWHTIPGNGAYVAVTGGLVSAGLGNTLAWLECREPTGAPAPEGVVCYRSVRRIPYAPNRITPELRGEVACYAPGLSLEQRVALAETSTREWRGWFACHARDLSPKQRIALAETSTPEWRGRVASYAPDLSTEQRVALKTRNGRT